MLGCDLRVGSEAPHSQFGEGARLHLCMDGIESADTSLQAIELDPSCSGQAYSSRPGTGPGYRSTNPGCILTVLLVPSMIRPLRGADAKSGKVV